MLVVTRKPGESLVCPELGIQIVILPKKNGNKIRIGIVADYGKKVLRNELLEQSHIDQFEYVSGRKLVTPKEKPTNG